MAQPIRPVVPPAPLRSDPDTFSGRFEGHITFIPQFVGYMDEIALFCEGQAAALVAANLPDLTGRALDAVRVSGDGSSIEYVVVSQNSWDFLALDTASEMRDALNLGEAATVDVSSDPNLSVDPAKLPTRALLGAIGRMGLETGMQWRGLALPSNTPYQNTEAYPKFVIVRGRGGGANDQIVEESVDGIDWYPTGGAGGSNIGNSYFSNYFTILPPGDLIRWRGGAATVHVKDLGV